MVTQLAGVSVGSFGEGGSHVTVQSGGSHDVAQYAVTSAATFGAGAQVTSQAG